MTEIKIRKKRPVWPWIVLVLIIIAVAYYLWANNSEATDDDMPKIGTDEQIDTGTGLLYETICAGSWA